MMRATHKKAGSYGYRAAIKDEAGRIVWVCSHIHRNRDMDTRTYGQSAVHCAQTELRRRQCEAVAA